FKGFTAQESSNGLRELLESEGLQSEVIAKQQQWVHQHSWAAVAQRLQNIIVGNILEERNQGPIDILGEDPLADTDTRLDKVTVTVRELLEAEFETKSAREFVHSAFQSVLGRECSLEELLSLEPRAARGASHRWAILKELYGFPEFEHQRYKLSSSPHFQTEIVPAAALLAAASDIDFVRDAYRRLLLREADKPGLENYVRRIKKGEVTRQGVIKAI